MANNHHFFISYFFNFFKKNNLKLPKYVVLNNFNTNFYFVIYYLFLYNFFKI